MDINSRTSVDNSNPSIAELNWNTLELTDLFLEDPPVLAHVELVDDPNAMIQIMLYDLLTELLCEV